ncbi:MAG: OmpH family outer membrane protein [Succinivibrio dextrinosolvens]|uniref:Periplasmic chaperone for outer membrane proteins Skp n=1 Tax=Succinivibrio dextrinosolvens TaxID=83771 RepID=A0A662ZAU5_9GAMM|nr:MULTISPECIES: OmpH family outer membrane protein [Succinivibrio]MBQ9219385.1 OmpH family outer membrane protein [Succinivibrio sp.]MDY6416427.1 OmpH family outer membrane protein [Succinivibrio dextrinosolvens]MDY6466831.1 OmpH family outer membrane protein [Succinivibrio dextrinosolvens]MDY6470654.1 OmpH family outer membrane protein [Succinivibrio dextrinosolvens]SFK25551.1 periplasmic chaperone for outer membrane proteins Skp [Succinivibrio dextrinosolvens]
MLKKLAIATALTFALTQVSFAEDKAPAATESHNLSIAVVNVPLIMSELPQAKVEAEKLQKEFGPRKAELDKIQEQGVKLEQELKTAKDSRATEIHRKLASLKSEFDLKAQALQEDSQKKQREAEVQLGRIVQEAIDRIAKERGIDLVVRGETVVYATDAVNISKDVIERASKLKPVKK